MENSNGPLLNDEDKKGRIHEQAPQENNTSKDNSLQNMHETTTPNEKKVNYDNSKNGESVISLSSEEENSASSEDEACSEFAISERKALNNKLSITPEVTISVVPKKPKDSQFDSKEINSDSKTPKDPQIDKQPGKQKILQKPRYFCIEVKAKIPSVDFESIAGYDKILKQLCEILLNLVVPEFYLKLGVKPPRGILIYGPSGCGKSTLAEAIAGQIQFKFIKVPANEIFGGRVGETEERLRAVFAQAILYAPCVLFVDEIDRVGRNRTGADADCQTCVTSQLLKCFDQLSEKSSNVRVLVVGATRNPDLLDPALRRSGRFEYEISIPVPDRKGRFRILQKLCTEMPMENDFDYAKIAELTSGYVAADIKALITRASTISVKRVMYSNLFEMHKIAVRQAIDESKVMKKITKQMLKNWKPSLTELLNYLNDPQEDYGMEYYVVKTQDFVDILKTFQPLAKNEGLVTVPDITWQDIGLLHNVRDKLRLAILAPVKHPKTIERLNVKAAPSGGVLLVGPPGCGKTLIAKAVANEAGINFITVKGPELLFKYWGQCERALHDCFERAHASAPCIIFFDEFDSLCPKRSSTPYDPHSDRVVNQLLTEIDGIQEGKGVYIMAATNRPDNIDSAILRPGRLDNILYIGMPDEKGRCEILRAVTKNGRRPVMAHDVDFQKIAEWTEGYTGADLSGLIRQASKLALRQAIANKTPDSNIFVTLDNIKAALNITRPFVSEIDHQMYEKLCLKYATIGGMF